MTRRLRYRTQRGFTLLEVLLAVLVTAVGLLSVAGLESMTQRADFDAVQRTAAAVLAQNYAERMRANPTQAQNYVTDAVVGIGPSNVPAVPGTDCTQAPCNPATLVGFDKYAFAQSLVGNSEQIPGRSQTATITTGGLSYPTACIQQIACATYQVTITWRGLSSLPADSTVQCGNQNTAYSDPRHAAGNTMLRRSLTLTSVIVDPTSAPCT